MDIPKDELDKREALKDFVLDFNYHEQEAVILQSLKNQKFSLYALDNDYSHPKFLVKVIEYRIRKELKTSDFYFEIIDISNNVSVKDNMVTIYEKLAKAIKSTTILCIRFRNEVPKNYVKELTGTIASRTYPYNDFEPCILIFFSEKYLDLDETEIYQKFPPSDKEFQTDIELTNYLKEFENHFIKHIEEKQEVLSCFCKIQDVINFYRNYIDEYGLTKSEKYNKREERYTYVFLSKLLDEHFNKELQIDNNLEIQLIPK